MDNKLPVLRDYLVSGKDPTKKRYRCIGCSEILARTTWINHLRNGCTTARNAPNIPCPQCNQGFHKREAMIKHYSATHKPISVQYKEVETKEDVLKLRMELENSCGCHFSKRSNKPDCTYYRCSLEGERNELCSSKGRKILRSVRSCTAFMSVIKMETGGFRAKYCIEHSHESKYDFAANTGELLAPESNDDSILGISNGEWEMEEDNVQHDVVSWQNPVERILKMNAVCEAEIKEEEDDDNYALALAIPKSETRENIIVSVGNMSHKELERSIPDEEVLEPATEDVETQAISPKESLLKCSEAMWKLSQFQTLLLSKGAGGPEVQQVLALLSTFGAKVDECLEKNI